MRTQAEQGTVRIDARIPANIKESLVMAAALEGRTQTDFLIAAVAEAARRTIAEHSVINLCLEDQHALAAALADDERMPSKRLQKAMRDHAEATRP